MSDPFRRVQPGDPVRIPAAAWNAMLDVVAEVRAGRLTGAGSPGSGPSPAVLLVRNAGASALPEYGVCAVTGTAVPVGPGFKAAPLLEVDAPTATAAVLVTLEPIPPGHAGRAVAAGAACVQIDVTDAAHARAAPVAGESGHLASAAAGPVAVLWKESGTGTKWAYVLLGAAGTAAGGYPQDASVIVDSVVKHGGAWGAGAVLYHGQYRAAYPPGASGNCYVWPVNGELLGYSGFGAPLDMDPDLPRYHGWFTGVEEDGLPVYAVNQAGATQTPLAHCEGALTGYDGSHLVPAFDAEGRTRPVGTVPQRCPNVGLAFGLLTNYYGTLDLANYIARWTSGVSGELPWHSGYGPGLIFRPWSSGDRAGVFSDGGSSLILLAYKGTAPAVSTSVVVGPGSVTVASRDPDTDDLLGYLASDGMPSGNGVATLYASHYGTWVIDGDGDPVYHTGVKSAALADGTLVVNGIVVSAGDGDMDYGTW